MKYTHADAQKFEIPGGTTGLIFPSHPKGEQTIVSVKTEGVYPEKGYSMNERCTETIYLTSGTLTITVDGEEETMNPGELLMILPGQKYTLRGKGEAIDIITPSWDAKQNHIIV